jgi:hypothetical protein
MLQKPTSKALRNGLTKAGETVRNVDLKVTFVLD